MRVVSDICLFSYILCQLNLEREVSQTSQNLAKNSLSI